MSFALVEQWIERQSLWRRASIDMEWIVVNDGKVPYNYTMGQIVIDRKPQPRELHSLCQNVITGLTVATGSLIFFIEDDDWTHPTYLERLWKAWDTSGGTILALGLTRALYYNVKLARARQCSNRAHSSLGSMAVDRKAIPAVKNIARCGNPTFDRGLWRYAKAHRWPTHLEENAKQPDGRWLHVGLKCMPGQIGIGIGHRSGGQPDQDHKLIKRWIGTDYESIKPYCAPCQRVDADTSKTSAVPKV